MEFFDTVIAGNFHCFWMDGCGPLTVRGHVIEFEFLPNAKPVARQPFPLSPYDEARAEYHIVENVLQAKLQIIDILKDGLPDFSTFTFVVGKDSKGMLGRMVCVCNVPERRRPACI